MRVLLVLALIPLLAACSVFSSSEPPASLADTPPSETVAGATDSTGVPTGETSPSDATLTPTTTATATPSGTSSPTGASTPTVKSAPTETATPPSPASPPAAKAPAATAMPAPVNPTPPSPSVAGTDISGKWVGSWVGNGLFNAPRQENLTLEIVQKGDSGYGRMVLDNATAAESVPWNIRLQGLGGIRVFAEIDGSKVKLVHEQDDRIFTANMVVMGDQMVGEVKGRKVRLLLARQARSNAPARDVPPQAAQLTPPPVAASQPVVPQQPPVAMAPAPQAQEPEKPKVEPPAQRPRNEDYVAVPELKSLFFDFDKSVLRPDAVDALSSNLTWLKENADTFVLIEGNADERGTAEYNLALGDRRAKSTQDYLEANGITKDRMSTVSYGKERPSCTDATEECRAQNRRSDFRIKSK
jgi:peptidoglycan-associated lipoprotein